MPNFVKMNGAGNDFILLDNRDGSVELDRGRIAALCDRHRGIGADGLLLVEESDAGADFRMSYFNSDGGEAEMCGNGARCFAKFARRISGGGDEVSFDTLAGRIRAGIADDGMVTLQMGDPRDLHVGRSLEVEGGAMEVHSVNTGVPHAVVEVEDLDSLDVARFGAAIRRHDAFAPAGTNVNFIRRTGADSLAIRTYERGVEGETLACGTGVVAAAIIFHHLHGVAPPITVSVRGGDDLRVGFRRQGTEFTSVTLCGPADFVFEGSVDPDMLR